MCSNKDILRKIHFILFCFRGSYYFTRVFISEQTMYGVVMVEDSLCANRVHVRIHFIDLVAVELQ